jgi:selenide,water dikinase
VTGFGIMGHGMGMASGSGVTLVFESQKFPLLPDAVRLAEKGYITGGCKRNRDYLGDRMSIEKSIREGLVEIALDPQTSGGLLIAIAKRDSVKLIAELHGAGVTDAVEVGYATSQQKPWVRLI